nr:hypothetical protein [Rhodoferax sp.]
MAMGLLALVTLAVFAQGQTPLDARALVLAIACVVTTCIAFIGWKKSPQGSLRWDGQHWYWSGLNAGSACQLSTLMDFQSAVVVLIKPEVHAPFSLWLEEAASDTSWRPLRRAIISSQTASDSKSKKPGRAAEEDLA